MDWIKFSLVNSQKKKQDDSPEINSIWNGIQYFECAPNTIGKTILQSIFVSVYSRIC